MSEYIECRNCDSGDCRGCNTYILSTMLYEGNCRFVNMKVQATNRRNSKTAKDGE